MRPLNLREFAEQLRLEGNPFADEILVLCEIERDVADPYANLCDDLDHYLPELAGKPDKQLERLGDRAALLDEIEMQLRDGGRDGDADDVIKEMIGTLADAEDILKAHGWAEGDFLDGLDKLAVRASKAAPPQEYDL